MSEEPNYFAIIPAKVRYDERLCAHAKLLYGEITALTKKEGFCWATNRYFADLYKTTDRSIRIWLAELRDAGHISTEVDVIGGNTRKIWLRNKTSVAAEQNFRTPTEENFRHNSTERKGHLKVQATEREIGPGEREFYRLASKLKDQMQVLK